MIINKFNLSILSGLALVTFPSQAAISFEKCQQIFLNGKSITYFIDKETSKESSDKNYLNKLKDLLKSEKCESLIRFASLRQNGILENRWEIGSEILDSVTKFHGQWLTPEDSDKGRFCFSNLQEDLYDPLVPAYHLSRALLQDSRKASEAVTSYGDLRSIRAGDNPTVGPRSGFQIEKLNQFFNANNEISFTSNEPLMGFIYQKRIKVKNFKAPKEEGGWSSGEINLFNHQGGGFLGSPSFISSYLPKGVKESSTYRSNGTTTLPRRIARAVLENLLCHKYLGDKTTVLSEELGMVPKPNDNTEGPFYWDHPVTKEKNCLSCHGALDALGSGLRHLTLVPSQTNCLNDSPTVLIPDGFKGQHYQKVWHKDLDKPFHQSYPVGEVEGKRFVGFAGLGKRLSESETFYQCQVVKYYQWISGELPTKELTKKLGAEYADHQNGLKLLDKIFNIVEVKK